MTSHIVMVDNEEEYLHTMSLILTMKGYRVTQFTNAKKALNEIAAMQEDPMLYDLLITDIDMPTMNGKELIDTLHRQGIRIPTIVMTGYGNKDLVIELMRKGCSDYIDKPVTSEIFLERVEKVLEDVHKAKKIHDQTEKFIQLGSFVTELVHDINNILCTSCGFADLAQTQFESKKPIKKYLTKICKSTTCASKLANQLLVISQKREEKYCPLNLGKILRDLMDMLQTVVGKSICISLQIEPKTSKIIADRASIERLLLNLLITIRDSIPRGGTLRISVKNIFVDKKTVTRSYHKTSGPHVCMTLDTGAGTANTNITDQPVQPCCTTKHENNKRRSSFQMVTKIIHKHNGFMTTSELKRGLLFGIYFPTPGEKYTNKGRIEGAI